MRVPAITAPSIFLTMLACATPEPVPSGPPPDWKLASASMAVGDNLQGTANGSQISLRIQGHNVTGPRASLDVGRGVVRGTGNSGRTIQVTIKENKAEGLVGGIPFSCIVDTNPDGSAHIVGAMGAGNADYILSPKAINGRIGVVVYQLNWNGEKYEGQMVPGGYGFLQLPAVLATWSDVEVAAFLSLVLMGA
jgi:hypothetical protein